MHFTWAAGFAAWLVAGCGSDRSAPLADVVHACELATACHIDRDFADCVYERSPFRDRDPAVSCLGRAGADCDAARRCANLGSAPTRCTPSPANSGVCDGNVVRWCSYDGWTAAADCAAVGLICATDSQGFTGCAAGTCTTSGAITCEGAAKVTCTNGVQQRQPCDIGTECLLGRDCIPNGPACVSQTYVPHCDGDLRVACTDDHEHRFDCATLGLHCVWDRQRQDTICANGTECQAFDQTCDSGTLAYCFHGKRFRADCRAAGFHGCDLHGCLDWAR